MNTERLQKLEEYLSADPSDPFLIYAIAQEYDRGDVPAEAEKWYLRLIQEHPAYVASYYQYGKLLEKMLRSEEALQIFDTGILKAMAAGDRHAAAELREARNQISGEEEDF